MSGEHVVRTAERLVRVLKSLPRSLSSEGAAQVALGVGIAIAKRAHLVQLDPVECEAMQACGELMIACSLDPSSDDRHPVDQWLERWSCPRCGQWQPQASRHARPCRECSAA